MTGIIAVAIGILSKQWRSLLLAAIVVGSLLSAFLGYVRWDEAR
jgi:hypothetical protein